MSLSGALTGRASGASSGTFGGFFTRGVSRPPVRARQSHGGISPSRKSVPSWVTEFFASLASRSWKLVTFEEAFQVSWPEPASADAYEGLHSVNHLIGSCKVDGLYTGRPWG